MRTTRLSRSRSSAVTLREAQRAVRAAQGRHRRAGAGRLDRGGGPSGPSPAGRARASSGAAILVERMAPPGVELLVSARADAVVPCIVVAIGGAWTELLDDAAIVPLPATSARVEAAIRALRGAPLLTGGRGRQPFDVAAAARLAAAAGELLVASGLELLELNPVLVHERGATAVDAVAACRADPAAMQRERRRRRRARRARRGRRAGRARARRSWCWRRGRASAGACGRRSSRTAPSSRWAPSTSCPGNTAVLELVDALRARALGQGDALRTARPARRHRHHARGARRPRWRRSERELAARAARRRERRGVPRLARHPGGRPRGDPRAGRDLVREHGRPGGGARTSPASRTSTTNRRRASPAATSGWRSRSPRSSATRCSWTTRRRFVRWGDGVRVASPRRRDRCRCLRRRGARKRARPDRLRAGPAGRRCVTRSGSSSTGTRRSCSCRSARPPPPSAVMNVPERYWTWTATGDGDQPQPVVSAFAGSKPALDGLEVEAGPEPLARLDRASSPRPRPRDERRRAVHLVDDPWVRAAYSTSPPPEVEAAVREPDRPARVRGRAHRR